MLRTYADVSKAQALVGYEPQLVLHEGIDDFVKWWSARFR